MPRTTYINSLLAAARAQHWTAADVEAMTYAQVAAACEVKIEANGDSPADFFFVNVRRGAALPLARDEWEAEVEARRLAVETVLSVARVPARVLVNDRGEIVVGGV